MSPVRQVVVLTCAALAAGGAAWAEQIGAGMRLGAVTDVAVTPAGTLLVVDGDARQLRTLAEPGRPGPVPRVIEEAGKIALVACAGDTVYVADREKSPQGYRVRAVAPGPDGRLIDAQIWHLPLQPRGLAVDPAGSVWVAATSEGQHTEILTHGLESAIYRLDPGADDAAAGGAGGAIGLALTRDKIPVEHTPGWLVGAGCDADGRFYVSDRDNGRVLVFDHDGNLVREVTGFAAATDCAVAPDGTLLVTDFHCVHLVTDDRHLVFGRRGSGEGELEWPMAVALDAGGHVAVADTRNMRVQRFPLADMMARAEPISAERADWLRPGTFESAATHARFPTPQAAADAAPLPAIEEPVELATAGEITLGRWRVRAARDAGELSLLEVLPADEDRLAAVLALGPRGAWRPGRVGLSAPDGGRSLVLQDFDLGATAGALALTPESGLAVRAGADGDLEIQVAFHIGDFDAAKWREVVGEDEPLHVLGLSLPGASMLYQGGFVVPLPDLDPYVFEHKRAVWGKGEWAPVVPVGACPQPAFGLWAPQRRMFAALDLSRDRAGDRRGNDFGFAAWARPGARAFAALCYPGAFEGTSDDPRRQRGPDADLSATLELVVADDAAPGWEPTRFLIERAHRRGLIAPARTDVAPDLSWLPPFTNRGRFGNYWLLRHDFAGDPWDPLTDPRWPNCPEAPTINPRMNARLGYMSGQDMTAFERRWLAEVEKAEFVEIDGEECVRWSVPQDTDRSDESATCHNGADNWFRAQMLLQIYLRHRDPRLLRCLDGVVRWAKHTGYTRGGIWVDPWAHFAFTGGIGADYLLAYHRAFRGDPERAALAAEALRLARNAVYNAMFVYLHDPDPYDRRDPRFLLQPINTHNWFGTVSWAETGPVWESVIAVCAETGDPILRSLITGHCEREYVGLWDALDGQVAENLWGGAFGRTWGAKGGKWGCGVPLVGRFHAEPMRAASARIVIGAKDALAFGKGRRDIGIAEYGFEAPDGFRIRLRADDGGPFDLHLTAPHRDLWQAGAWINGEPAGERLIRSRLGEDIYLRAMRSGDLIEIGRRGLAARAAAAPTSGDTTNAVGSRAPGHRCLDLSPLADASPRADWSVPTTFAGLTAGEHWASGVPYLILDPHANDGRWAVRLGARPATVEIGPGRRVYLFGSHQGIAGAQGPTVQALTPDGGARGLAVNDAGVANSGWPLSRWVLRCVWADLPAGATGLRLSGDWHLFAVTVEH